MESPRQPLTIRPFTALLIALVPALLLARCGIWPTFPDDLRRDAGADASRDGMVRTDAAIDAPALMDVRDVGMDSPPMVDVRTDAGPDSNFRTCPTVPSGPFALEPFSTGTPGGHDLVFDGRGNLVVGGRQVARINSSGMATDLTTETDGLGINGIRFLPNGDLVFTATLGTAGPGMRAMTGTTVRTIATERTYMRPSGVAVDPTGAVYFTDTGSTADGVLYRIEAGATTATVVASGLGSLTGLALTPDGRKLYVASPSMSRIFELNLAPNGTLIGPPRSYVDSVSVNGNGLAFDVCGNLYLSDRDRYRILRVPPGGGSFVTIIDSSMDDATPPRNPWGIAFGRGPGFEDTHLYLVDATTGNVVRANVMVQGSPVVTPL